MYQTQPPPPPLVTTPPKEEKKGMYVSFSVIAGNSHYHSNSIILLWCDINFFWPAQLRSTDPIWHGNRFSWNLLRFLIFYTLFSLILPLVLNIRKNLLFKYIKKLMYVDYIIDHQIHSLFNVSKKSNSSYIKN
jgi:hypothetical protein